MIACSMPPAILKTHRFVDRNLELFISSFALSGPRQKFYWIGPGINCLTRSTNGVSMPVVTLGDAVLWLVGLKVSYEITFFKLDFLHCVIGTMTWGTCPEP